MFGRGVRAASGAAGLLRRRPAPAAVGFSTQPAEKAAAAASAVAAPARTRRALPAPLTVTPNAAKRILELLSGSPNALGVLLGVKRRGCNGMSYTLNYAEETPPPTHERVECDGAVVWVEPPALFHIARGPRPTKAAARPPSRPFGLSRSAMPSQVGTVMDFEETALETGFTFTNPNEKGRCGCGESFNV